MKYFTGTYCFYRTVSFHDHINELLLTFRGLTIMFAHHCQSFACYIFPSLSLSLSSVLPNLLSAYTAFTSVFFWSDNFPLFKDVRVSTSVHTKMVHTNCIFRQTQTYPFQWTRLLQCYPSRNRPNVNISVAKNGELYPHINSIPNFLP
jgi:hypothetical protein